MPHLKLEGFVDVKELWEAPPRFNIRDGSKEYAAVLKEAFLSKFSRGLVLRFVVVEGRLTQVVQVKIHALNDEETEWMVGLDKGLPVLRTAGIKVLVAAVGEWLVLSGLVKTFTTVAPFEKEGLFHARHSLVG